jgi:hypothetical protein
MNKDLRKQKKALKAQGYDKQTAKRMAMTGEGADTTTVYMSKGGKLPKYSKGGVMKTSTKRTKHRGKTTNGGYGNGI